MCICVYVYIKIETSENHFSYVLSSIPLKNLRKLFLIKRDELLRMGEEIADNIKKYVENNATQSSQVQMRALSHDFSKLPPMIPVIEDTTVQLSTQFDTPLSPFLLPTNQHTSRTPSPQPQLPAHQLQSQSQSQQLHQLNSHVSQQIRPIDTGWYICMSIYLIVLIIYALFFST